MLKNDICITVIGQAIHKKFLKEIQKILKTWKSWGKWGKNAQVKEKSWKFIFNHSEVLIICKFSGGTCCQTPIKVFRSVANIYNRSGKDQGIVLEIFCTHPHYVNYGFLI